MNSNKNNYVSIFEPFGRTAVVMAAVVLAGSGEGYSG